MSKDKDAAKVLEDDVMQAVVDFREEL